MRGQRSLTSFTIKYPMVSSMVSPKGINKNIKSRKKTSPIILDICGKLVALLLFALNVIIVGTIGTNPLLTLSLKNVTNNNTNVVTQTCPKVCVCKLTEEHSITTDCTNANLTSVPNNINTNTTSLNLNKNRISELSKEEFSGLKQLKRLWLNDNQLSQIPTDILKLLPKIEALSIADNRIKSVEDFAFPDQRHLAILDLQNNQINDITPLAFSGLHSLKILEINGNRLQSLPIAISSLHSLRELAITNNELKYLSDNAFKNNSQLTILELKGNPLEDVARNAFVQLPNLKKLTLSEVRKLQTFPNFSGTIALEHLKIDRGELRRIPSSLCDQVPRLKSLIVKSNHIALLPKLRSCNELKLLDFSYNHIKTFGDEPVFQNQSKLIDLFMGHNLITNIPQNAFIGLSSLKVLNLVNNRISFIHPQAFVPLISLKDINLGDNRFPELPSEGIQNITEIKVYGNPNLKEFPPIETFPKVHTLALSYAYHCCAYIGRTHSPTDNPNNLQESIVWLDKEDAWNTNITDVWPGYVNFSTKFEEFANQLWKTFGRDYVIPDNLAEYAEQYFEDYKQVLNGEESFSSYPVQCLPKPGPFMPCKDLFDWWTLRCGVWIVFLLALLGNGVVVVVLVFGRSKIDVPRFLVCNLAVADFFMGVYLGVLAIVDASTLGEFKIYAIPWQTSWGCQMAGFFGVFSSELSVYTLAVITMERNYAITHAMHLNKRLSLKHAGYIMSIGWIFALCMAILPLVGISDYRKFAVCLPFEIEDSPWSLSYVVFLIIINGIAFLVLMGCYLRMYCAIRGSQAWNSNDSRIAKRMALLVFTDFLCWSPIAFFSLTAVSGYHLISLEEAKVFTIFVLPLNSCANPFLYAIFTKQFKKECVLLCKRIEESRVTRGIGRCRHSSNFSNRHTPAVSNSAAERKSSDHLPPIVCQCGVHKPKVSIEEMRLISHPKVAMGWKHKAINWLNFNKKGNSQKSNPGNTNGSAQNKKNFDRTTGRTSSIDSENFSSRSDSWRNPNIPMKQIDKNIIRTTTSRHTCSGAVRGRRNSWNTTRKTSHDSTFSSSTSTYTSRLSRSSFSSDSSSRQTGSSGLSSGCAGPSGIQTKELTTKQKILNRRNSSDKKICRQTPTEEKRSIRVDSTGYLCHNCSRKDILQKNNNSPKNIKFKNKELEEKFNCFYNRLAETSQEESSDFREPVIVSTDLSTCGENRLDLSTHSRDTAETSIQDSITSQDIEVHTIRTQPSIEIEPQSPSAKRSFDDDMETMSKATSSRASSSHSVKTAFHYSRETIKDPNRLGISQENISKTHSLTNVGKYCETSLKGRKVASDNSLKKLSIKNLPSLLRSLSSQSTIYFNKKRSRMLSPRQTHSVYRSADNMSHLGSKSFEGISHQMSDSNLKQRRSTAFELYETKEAEFSDSDVYEDIDDYKLLDNAENGKLIGDNKTKRDCSDKVDEQLVHELSGIRENEEVPLCGAEVRHISNC